VLLRLGWRKRRGHFPLLGFGQVSWRHRYAVCHRGRNGPEGGVNEGGVGGRRQKDQEALISGKGKFLDVFAPSASLSQVQKLRRSI